MGKARRIAAAIRETGEYRWVGIYDAEGEAGRLVAWSGSSAEDASGSVVGRLRVERDPSFALTPEDRACLEACAGLVTSLFG